MLSINKILYFIFIFLSIILLTFFYINFSPFNSSDTYNFNSNLNWKYPIKHLNVLYKKYHDDLIIVRNLAKEFCENFKVPKGWPHLHVCQYGLIESEINYLRIRELKPKYVLEVSSAIGYSTLWILKALEDNNIGELYSFDVFNTPWPNVLSEKIKIRWKFINGDVRQTIINKEIQKINFDYIFIDTAHEKMFTKWYVKNIIENWSLRNKTVLFSVHDIYSLTDDMPLIEGIIVLQWLSYSQMAKNVFSVSSSVNKNFHDKIVKIRENVLGIEESKKAIGGTNYLNSCSLFFETDDINRSCYECII
jgi:hypothetical protein